MDGPRCDVATSMSSRPLATRPTESHASTGSGGDRSYMDGGPSGSPAMTEQRDYMFENRAAEQERLVAQATIFDPHSRRLLVAAGLVRGMRVLDLGSGAGNMAMIAADLVGPEGTVIGI